MAPQVMHRCLAVISSWFILALHRSHYVCLGAYVSPTSCSNLGDVCSSQLPGVAPFLMGIRQRRSSARPRARGKNVNIMFIIRIWQKCVLAIKIWGFSVCDKCLTILSGSKTQDVVVGIAKHPPGPGIPRGRSCTTPHAPSPQNFAPRHPRVYY